MEKQRTVLLGINGEDPSDSFIARFASSKKTVKKVSQSYFKRNPFPGSLRDRSTDERGVSFSVGGPISWLSSDRVEARWGMYCGGLCADAGVYRLEKRRGSWEVTGNGFIASNTYTTHFFVQVFAGKIVVKKARRGVVVWALSRGSWLPVDKL